MGLSPERATPISDGRATTCVERLVFKVLTLWLLDLTFQFIFCLRFVFCL